MESTGRLARETYQVGPAQTSEPSEGRSEIAWPIR
jgi:hypothetical protein